MCLLCRRGSHARIKRTMERYIFCTFAHLVELGSFFDAERLDSFAEATKSGLLAELCWKADREVEASQCWLKGPEKGADKILHRADELRRFD
jgi:hypothetical protein